MMLNELTDHLELLTTTHTTRSASGRGKSNKLELTGIKKLRELILELAVRGKLVPQSPKDEPASVLLSRIAAEKARLIKERKIKKQQPLAAITDDEKPFALPRGWEWVRLGNIANRIGSGSTPRGGKSAYSNSGYPFLRSQNIWNHGLELKDIAYISESIHHKMANTVVFPNDILLNITGASLGRCTIYPDNLGEANVSQHVTVIRLTESALKEYMHYCILSPYIQSLIWGRQVGMAREGLSKKVLELFEIPLPPLTERKHIVAKVNDLMALCDQLEQDETDSIAAHQALVDAMLTTLTDSKNAAELTENWSLVSEHFETLFTTETSITRLRQTILQLAVMGRLVPQNPDDEPAARLLERIAVEKARLIADKVVAKQKPLPAITDADKPFELPLGWAWARLEDVVNIHSGITKGRKLADRELVSVPYLRVANVQRAHLVLNEIKEVEIPVEEQDKYQVKARDLLITEGGDWDKVGRTAIWSDELPYMAHQNHVFKARIFLSEQSELWLERYLNGPVARQYFAQSSKQTTNLASINKTQLRGCPIAIPPTNEKDRIVTRVNELMTLCDTLQAQVQQAQTIQQQLAATIVEQAIG